MSFALTWWYDAKQAAATGVRDLGRGQVMRRSANPAYFDAQLIADLHTARVVFVLAISCFSVGFVMWIRRRWLKKKAHF